MNEFEVWSEGYAATGEHGTAVLLGKATANSFKEACNIVCKDLVEYYNSNNLSVWSCKLFDNEKEARKRFG